jgi:hypothetical protein
VTAIGAEQGRVTLAPLLVKTAIVHTVTYFVAGVLAYNLADYATTLSRPPMSHYMRPVTDRWVMVGPLLQPIRGIVFGLALYPLRTILFERRRGWLIMWWLLVALGILSTFGAAPGSMEGLIYTQVPIAEQMIGLWEVLLQSFLLAFILHYWITRPSRWLNWTLGVALGVIVVLLTMGLLVGRR